MDVPGYASGREVKEVGLDVEEPGELLDQVTAWRFTQVVLQIVEIRCRDGPPVLDLDTRRQLALGQLGAFASFRDKLAERLHSSHQPPGSIPQKHSSYHICRHVSACSYDHTRGAGSFLTRHRQRTRPRR